MTKQFCFVLLTICTAAAVSAFVAQSGLGQATEAKPEEDELAPAMTFVRGANLPVRRPNEDEFSDQTKEVSVEVFRDEDFGTLTMLSSNGGMAVVPFPCNYDVRVVRVGEGFQAIRYMPRLGATWMMEEGEWVETKENGDLFLGDYDIKLVVNNEEETMDVVRLEKITGTTWYLAEDGWREIKEPETD